jgi:hypothetical protein
MSEPVDFPKLLGAMERLAVDMGKIGMAAIELGEAYQRMVKVGATDGNNPNYDTELAPAIDLLKEKRQTWAEVVAIFADPQGRHRRDIVTVEAWMSLARSQPDN